MIFLEFIKNNKLCFCIERIIYVQLKLYVKYMKIKHVIKNYKYNTCEVITGC